MTVLIAYLSIMLCLIISLLLIISIIKQDLDL